MVGQLDLFPASAPEPGKVDVLDRLEASPVDPSWDAKMHRYWVTVFPQMLRWLPLDEAAALCVRFDVAIVKMASQKGP